MYETLPVLLLVAGRWSPVAEQKSLCLTHPLVPQSVFQSTYVKNPPLDFVPRGFFRLLNPQTQDTRLLEEAARFRPLLGGGYLKVPPN